MQLPSHELAAFAAAARLRSFSAAALAVHITQPALTQRIQSLERALATTLFIRDRKGVRLTEAGERLLRYCQVKEDLEQELLADLGRGSAGALGGTLRLAGYSTVLHPVLVPAIAPLLRANPDIRFDMASREMGDLPGLLLRGEADLVVLDRTFERADVESLPLGHESYVLIESAAHATADVYLDHDPADRTTERFLKLQGRGRRPFRRAYMDDIDGILRGVALGLGRGVVPRHLLAARSGVRVVADLQPLEIPVVLHRRRQPYHSRLQQAVVDALVAASGEFLSARPRPRRLGARPSS